MSKTEKQSVSPDSVMGLIVSGIGHSLGTSIIFLIFGWSFLTEGAWRLFQSGLQDDQIRSAIVTELAIAVALSIVTWATFYGLFSWIKASRRRRKTLKIVRARGSVMTETLIVIPLFILMMFGLAQMGINSMAGLLTTLGTFEAARTLAVWGPEIGNNRSGTAVTREDAIDRARMSAAGVITPVAAMSATNVSCSKSTAFRKLLRGLAASGMLLPVEGLDRYSTFADSLDTAGFGRRGPSKLAGAYCSTAVDFSGTLANDPDETGQSEFTTKVTYSHKMTFPFVGLAFGGIPTTSGWKKDIVRDYKLTHHLTPNPELPKTNDIL